MRVLQCREVRWLVIQTEHANVERIRAVASYDLRVQGGLRGGIAEAQGDSVRHICAIGVFETQIRLQS